MQRMMVFAAERHGKFVADLASEGSGLRKLQVVGIAGRALADQAELGQRIGLADRRAARDIA